MVAPLAIAVVFLGGDWLAAFVGILAAIMAWEWWRLVDGQPAAFLGLVESFSYAPWCGLALLTTALAATLSPTNGAIAVGLAAVTPLAYFAAMGRTPVGVWMSVGLSFIAAAVVAFLALRAHPSAGLETALWLIAVVVAADSAAYFGGRLIGGPKLWPSVSPKKTWAGFIAGVGAGAATSVLFGLAAGTRSGMAAAAVGAGVAAAGQAGDLFESFVKRRHDAKDASGLMPGHGGALDRLDGFLAAACGTALAAAAGADIWIAR